MRAGGPRRVWWPAIGWLGGPCQRWQEGRQGPCGGAVQLRWLHAVVEVDLGKPLRVVSIYGHDSGQPEAAEKNAALFQEVCEALAGLGAAQWIVGGDWNEEAPAIWSLVAAEGRGLLLPRAPDDGGPGIAWHL